MKFIGFLLSILLLIPSHGEELSFNRDVRPILADACFHCHGPDPGTREADLRFDTEAGFFDPDSGPTVVKGQPEKSPLYQRIVTTDPDDIMPPQSAHRTMKPEEIALIRQWIEEGAPWQPHWSLIPPQRPEVPANSGQTWGRNPIDAFVLDRLSKAGLQPNPPADPHTLVRRISLDLTGLPPAPEVVAAYAGGTPLTQERIAALIDELMKSPHYGEHRARYWLDAARYGDTHGLHFDNYREMWPYRDWVVNAFNRNLHFDQFTLQQLAGDLLPEPSMDQLIATGFQRCNITTNEGGTIDEENLANYASDRVQTLGWVYFGLTTNCAQCHDHKFDPLTQKDYYSLAAFFRNTTQGPKDGNTKDGKGPALIVPAEKDLPRWHALPQEIAAAATQRDERRKAARPQFEQWLAQAKPSDLNQDVPSRDLAVHLPLNEGAGLEVSGTCRGPMTFQSTGPVSWTPDGKLGPAPIFKRGASFDLGAAGDFEKNQPFSYGGWIKVDRNGQTGGIISHMDEKGGYRGWDLWLQDRGLGVHIIDQWPGNALKVSTRNAVITPRKWQHVFVTYDGSGKAKGVKIYINGVAEKLITNSDTLQPSASIRTQTPLRIGQRSHIQVFDDGSIQDVRIYSRAVNAKEVQAIMDVVPLQGILAAAAAKRTPQQREALFTHFLATRDAEFQKRQDVVAKLETEKQEIEKRSPVTHVQKENADSPAMANILRRGQYDQVGEEVTAAVPAALGVLPQNAPPNRLGLAQWIVSPNNPLTARVTVNRLWQQLFGVGLVSTSEDFGIMGSAPSHPELLDWLAVEFRESGWDVKRFLKLLMTSAAYQQSAATSPEKLEQDRDNRLLSRGPRFRMDGEMLRDYALAVSGLLSETMGGPGTKPYQPDNIWNVVGLPNGDTRNYVQDQGENLYRRTLYNFWKRMAPSPNMEVFNAPSREVCTVRRERTNTPLQALVTLNDVQFVEAARHLAQTLVAAHGNDPAAVLHDASERVLCRPLKANESQLLLSTYRDLRAHYQAQPAEANALLEFGESPLPADLPPAETAAWTMVCSQLLNLDEALNK
ncbi:MAG: DUF1553 domain-containing protein [Verrucomicrobiales bacterium]|nr:DUF1553 domain-containing protein [Verrucomicrobiales bacterium]